VRASMMVYDKIMDPTKTFETTQPELFPDDLELKVVRVFTEDNLKDLKPEYIKSFDIEAMLIEDLETKYDVSDDMKLKI
jgi:hypothetical protein